MIQSPTYFAIIPANVRYSKVTANAKLLYGELTALSNKEGYCWASNQYFAELYGVTKQTVSGWISELLKAGFITSTVEDNNFRKIYISGGVKENPKGGTEKPEGGASEKPEHNNTSIINTNTGETDVSQMPIEVVVEDSRPPKKKTPDIPRQVFNVFSDVIGKNPLNWRTNKTQRQCAENLYTERGLDQIRKALEKYMEYRGEPYCPQINSPYDLDSKWSQLYEFIKKQD